MFSATQGQHIMKAKPFIKWVGGKGQLIEQLEALLPADFDKWENVTYIEPFVGGGGRCSSICYRHKGAVFTMHFYSKIHGKDKS